MANTIAQNRAVGYSGLATSYGLAFAGACTNPSLLVAMVGSDNDITPVITGVSDPTNGAFTQDAAAGATSAGRAEIWSRQNTATTALTVTAASNVNTNFVMKLYEVTGAATSSAKDVSGSQSTNSAPSIALVTTTNNCSIFAFNGGYPTMGAVNDSGYTRDFGPTAFGNDYWVGERLADVGAAGTNTLTMGYASSRSYQAFAAVAYKTAAAAGGVVGSNYYRFVAGMGA